MDLSFGPEYDDFRAEVVDFLTQTLTKPQRATTYVVTRPKTGKNC